MSLGQKIVRVPDGPGVYFMKDQTGRVIYIGKAKNLKKRLKSYVVNKIDEGYHAIKTARLLSRVEPLISLSHSTKLKHFFSNQV